MRLTKLLKHIDGTRPALPAGGSDPDVVSIHYHSKDVRPGGLFVAICGQAADGHDFIDDALSRGACAVVAERRTSDDGPIFCVPDSRLALAQLAAVFHGDPSVHMTLIGVTGTNGKTTVTYLVEGMLTAAGLSAGVIGTNNCRYAGRIFDTPVTTPESLDLQCMLADMRAEGVSHVVMEVSSHGIDLKRVASCRFDVGAFTNLTQDHLDYHGTMEDYWHCKTRFFTENLPHGHGAGGSVAAINMDNTRGRTLFRTLQALERSPDVVTYGRGSENDVHVRDASIDVSGIRGTIVMPQGRASFRSRLVGAHNMENILCAAAIAAALKLPLSAVEGGIGAMANIPGRLERVDDSEGRMVFVDYAHTPDALENVLRTLRSISPHRLICVFGCGGDRDRRKRPLMGKIAGELCDLAVVTSDNPRTEAPGKIIADIAEGVRREMSREFSMGSPGQWIAGRGFMVISDRAEAIQEAIRWAEAEDVVLIAGKGHETYQIVGREKRDFDDRRTAAEALEDIKGSRARSETK